MTGGIIRGAHTITLIFIPVLFETETYGETPGDISK